MWKELACQLSIIVAHKNNFSKKTLQNWINSCASQCSLHIIRNTCTALQNVLRLALQPREFYFCGSACGLDDPIFSKPPWRFCSPTRVEHYWPTWITNKSKLYRRCDAKIEADSYQGGCRQPSTVSAFSLPHSSMLFVWLYKCRPDVPSFCGAPPSNGWSLYCC